MGHVRKVPSKRQAVVDDDTKLNLLLALEEYPITPALDTGLVTTVPALEKSHAGKMEVDSVNEVFQRSEEKHNVKYAQYISDGDSKTSKAILDLDPYNNDPKVMKKECVGHVEKNAWEPGSVMQKKTNKGLGEEMNSVVENSHLHETCPPEVAALEQGSTAAILV
ncbi:hypothetical protein NQ318_019300 [Aromia moschata]|uniref:Mutator-like transposase domain-containing protein n=1 Tax=Aromia moschata TaxID=1265417 RepID=A0AAV8X419_9CUCU|nr:hypothetical protein NQ318_019300 [Aromia moschata]